MNLTLWLLFCVSVAGSAVRAENPPVEGEADSDPPRYIQVSLSIYDVSENVAKEMFESAAAVADHSEALKQLEASTTRKDVSLVVKSGIPVLSGSVGELNLTKKFDYPDVTWASDGKSFQVTQKQEEFGTTLEVEPVFGDHVPDYVWLDYKLTHTPYLPTIQDVKITLPDERTLKPKVISAYKREFSSSVVMRNGASMLVGSFTIVGDYTEGFAYRVLYLSVDLPEPVGK